jgi:ABC-2 type transport system ATP-binding protein
LLDEPTRSLDPAGAEHAWELVRSIAANGAAVVLATHSFEEAAAVADSICVLVQGRVVTFQPIGSKDDRDSLRDIYFRATGETSEHPVGGRV